MKFRRTSADSSERVPQPTAPAQPEIPSPGGSAPSLRITTLDCQLAEARNEPCELVTLMEIRQHAAQAFADGDKDRARKLRLFVKAYLDRAQRTL